MAEDIVAGREPKDSLGDRMKRQYEDRTRYSLPRRTYTIIRIDGKSFHTFTRGMEKPFDKRLEVGMDMAACELCTEAMGVRFAYGQSDEYSFLLTDFEQITSESWFDGNIQKVCSVAASIFTRAFNEYCSGALFDARVFTVADPIEVENYFVWRQQDAVRNSIQSLGQYHFSPKQLHQVTCEGIKAKLLANAIDWGELPMDRQRGRCVIKDSYEHEGATRTRWVCDLQIPVFTENREYLRSRVPRISV